MQCIKTEARNVRCYAQYIKDRYPNDESIDRWYKGLLQTAGSLEDKATVLEEVFLLTGSKPKN